MRLISSYRMLCTIIIMGSYSRSLLIASVVSLIGIGICLALEHRWRNLGQAPSDRRLVRSDRVLVKTTTSKEAEDNPQTSGESLPFDDGSREHRVLSEEVLKVDNSVENDDDFTVLFDPMSNLSIHVKSSPGLPKMDIDHETSINKKDDNQQSQMEDTIEDIESCKSCSELLSEVGIETTTSWIEQILENIKLGISRDNSSEAAQPNKESKEAVEDQMVSSTLITLENVKLDISRDSFSEANQPNKESREAVGDPMVSSTLITQDNDYLINDYQGTIVNEKQKCPLQNDSLHLIKDYQEHRVGDKLENNPVENSSIAHNLEQCTEATEDINVTPEATEDINVTPEATEDKSIAPSFNPYPTETFVLNVETNDLNIPEIFMTKTILIAEPTYSFAVNHKSDIHPDIQSSSSQEMNELFSENNSVLSGIGDFQHSLQEETRSARSVKESLEETYASISSVPQSPRQLEKDSTVPPLNTENLKCENKSHQNRPIRNGLRYSDMVAIPKKAKLHYEDSSGESNEKVKIPKTPTHVDKNRVRRLVGFFENKCDKH